MPPSPPSAAALTDALSRHQFACDTASAAVFLASPVACAPGVDSGAANGRLWVRSTETRPGSSLGDVAAAASRIAATAHTRDDTYLNLDSDACTWFKLITTGTRRRVAGPSMLWGTPRVWAERDVRPAQVAAYVHHARHGLLDAPPALISAGTPFLVDQRGKDVVLRAVPAAVRGSQPTGGVGPQVADTLGCALVAARSSAVPQGVWDDPASAVVTLRAWLPGRAQPVLVTCSVTVSGAQWEFAELEEPPPGRSWRVAATYDDGSSAGPRTDQTWMARPERSWVHRMTGAIVHEVR